MEQIFLHEGQWKKLAPDIDSKELKSYLSQVWQNRNRLISKYFILESKNDPIDKSVVRLFVTKGKKKWH